MYDLVSGGGCRLEMSGDSGILHSPRGWSLDDCDPAPTLHEKSHVWDLDCMHTDLILQL